ncbi:MAG: Ldh family oxidoreductase [Chloroflexota bacterium]|nr:Ldh family oxidoreductase [Dehalococcoidia bacterium]MEC9271872.1 Ldh family oxidoreductase [Chloroflexota bacterium]
MLEQFKVTEHQGELVDGEVLKKVVSKIFQTLGVPDEDALLGADVLVQADLRGVDSHGVSNMLKHYVTGLKDGSINPRPNWKVIRETPTTANIDSDRGLGTIVTPKAMDIAIDKAKTAGIGMVTVGNGRHLGMAAYHAMKALGHDMIGVCMTSTPVAVLPTFGAEPRLGTNPIAVAVPAKSEFPFVFDAATSSVASNKIEFAHRLGIDIPGAWVAAPDGKPIMEPIQAPENVMGSGFSLLPLGGNRELGSHKGYGLGCFVDIMAGLLTGFGYGASPGAPNFGHYVAAYSIDAFTDTTKFKEQMDEWSRMMQSTKLAPGQERVYVPGQPEFEMELKRRKSGIPLHSEVVDWIRNICREQAVKCLF